VRLRFRWAEITKDGKTVHEANPPTLPFTLPRGTGHIRLVYFVRLSQADHNMADPCIETSGDFEHLYGATEKSSHYLQT
jgi:hypothetical protein